MNREKRAIFSEIYRISKPGGHGNVRLSCTQAPAGRNEERRRWLRWWRDSGPENGEMKRDFVSTVCGTSDNRGSKDRKLAWVVIFVDCAS
jgi:hypothetical protein